MHGIGGLIEGETILNGVIVHALDARHRAPQRLRGADVRMSDESNQGESRRMTETVHGNISTTQRGKRKRIG
jgi:hypothetical protein